MIVARVSTVTVDTEMVAAEEIKELEALIAGRVAEDTTGVDENSPLELTLTVATVDDGVPEDKSEVSCSLAAGELEELTECCPLEVTLDDGAPSSAGDVSDKELEETHDDDHPIELCNGEGNESDRSSTVLMEEDRVLETAVEDDVDSVKRDEGDVSGVSLADKVLLVTLSVDDHTPEDDLISDEDTSLLV
ncbi:hypothetical protein OXX79_005952 [Metschnikowia pulcherrima]